jgi:hypothetical protein
MKELGGSVMSDNDSCFILLNYYRLSFFLSACHLPQLLRKLLHQFLLLSQLGPSLGLRPLQHSDKLYIFVNLQRQVFNCLLAICGCLFSHLDLLLRFSDNLIFLANLFT